MSHIPLPIFPTVVSSNTNSSLRIPHPISNQLLQNEEQEFLDKFQTTLHLKSPRKRLINDSRNRLLLLLFPRRSSSLLTRLGRIVIAAQDLSEVLARAGYALYYERKNQRPRQGKGKGKGKIRAGLTSQRASACSWSSSGVLRIVAAHLRLSADS